MSTICEHGNYVGDDEACGRCSRSERAEEASAAVLAEREACAKLAEDMAAKRSECAAILRAKEAPIAANHHTDAAYEIRVIAVAIRARGGTPNKPCNAESLHERGVRDGLRCEKPARHEGPHQAGLAVWHGRGSLYPEKYRGGP